MDDEDAGLEANLASISDEDWLRAHKQLIDSGDIPAEELAYLYDPDRDPATVDLSDLTIDPDPKEPSDG